MKPARVGFTRQRKRRTHDAAFNVQQVAGSCRIEGIPVSPGQERLLHRVADGSIDGNRVRAQLVAMYKNDHKLTRVKVKQVIDDMLDDETF